MKHNALNFWIAATALCAAGLSTHAQSTPLLRSYSISGNEDTHYYSSGWVTAAQTYTGTFDLLSETEARFTKHYADGSSIARDLILHWEVDLNASVQSGTAAEVPDPTNPVIERTTYVVSLQTDGVRHTMQASFETRAFLTIPPFSANWYPVAYGEFGGHVVSPLGTYGIHGTEQSGKTVNTYSGTLQLLSASAGRLTKVYANGTSTTVNLALSSLDLDLGDQSLAAVQVENAPGQVTTYEMGLSLSGTLYTVQATHETIAFKGRNSRTVGTGSFGGTQ